jgi:hypothetical protein
VLDATDECVNRGFIANDYAMRKHLSNQINLTLGNSQDWRGLIGKDVPRGVIAKDILQICSRSRSELSPLQNEILQRVEKEQAKKFGSKSTFEGWFKQSALEKVTAVFDSSYLSNDLNRDALDSAGSIMLSYIPAQSLTMTPLEEVLKSSNLGSPSDITGLSLDTSKSSGYPFLAGRYKPGPDQTPNDRMQSELAYNYLMRTYKTFMPQVMKGKLPRRLMCNTHFRIVSVGEEWKGVKKKSRLVIAVEKVEALMGKRWAGPVQQTLKETTFQLKEVS